MWKLIALASLAVAGCGAKLGDGPEQTPNDANGGGGADSDSSGGGMQVDAAVDAAPACANGRVVYLNFGGVTLTDAATDSTQDRAAWLTNTSAVVPPYHQNVTGRLIQIAQIVAGAKQRLAATPIEVVTTRPASGPYVMIVFGGQNTGSGGTVGTQYTFATSDHDCGDLVKNDVGWISDAPDVTYVPDLVMGTIGWSVGLNGTNDTVDCMCGWANTCAENAGVDCTISSSIASTTSSGNTTCPNQNPQNEVAAFSTAFCQ